MVWTDGNPARLPAEFKAIAGGAVVQPPFPLHDRRGDGSRSVGWAIPKRTRAYSLIKAGWRLVNVRYAPISDQNGALRRRTLCQKQTFRHSFDHLVGEHEQRGRDLKAERLCGL